MKKIVLTIFLGLIFVISVFMACGNGQTAFRIFNQSLDNKAVSDEGAERTQKEEPYTIVMGYVGDVQTDEETIESAINAILEPELNARIDLKAYSWGSYQQEIQLTLSGEEKLDIVPIVIMNAASYVSNNQLVDLTDLIEQYGTNIKKAIEPEFLTCPKIGDFTYGVTTLREQITWEGVIMRADLLEEAGYIITDNFCNEITNLEQLGEAYEKIYAAHPDMIMLASAAGNTPLFRWEVFDNLADGFGVLMNYGQSTRVVNLYETKEFKDFAKRLYEWNQAGYLSPDAATNIITITNQIKAGAAFSYFTPIKAGAAEQDELNTGYDLAIAPLFGSPFITSYSVNFFTWGIAKNSEHPENAFQVLDYIYGSSEIMNLLNWGLEDIHYKVIDRENKVISYAEGSEASKPGYMMNLGWEFPNQELAYVWEGETSAKWDKQREYIALAARSKALGFSFDTSKVSNELNALYHVKNMYYDAIGTGTLDPADAIEEFNQALYDAGLQKVIDEKQIQLDAWLAGQ
ncbi:MAG: transporter substrate-binding protein [Herbinix sp.]|nr:transporter substrate-binding protein [Herbinix sp.]